MRLSSNIDNQNKFAQPQQQQILYYGNSVDSTGGSFNSSSFLTAANTLVFNSPPLSGENKLTKIGDNNSSNFSKTLLQMQQQQNSNQDDLDFDLHYIDSKKSTCYKNHFENDLELFEEENHDDVDLYDEFNASRTEQANTQPVAQSHINRILNNPIDFRLKNQSKNVMIKDNSDLVDSIKNVNFINRTQEESSPTASNSLAA